MNPLVTDVLERQLRSLRRLYGILLALAAGLGVATFLVPVPEGLNVPGGLPLVETAMGVLCAGMLLLAVPLSRRRLLDPARARAVDAAGLVSWGLPADIDPTIGRQAVYLTRYSAGCVVTWGLAASVGLYGVVSRLMGAWLPVAAIFTAASLFTLLLLPPRIDSARRGLEAI